MALKKKQRKAAPPTVPGPKTIILPKPHHSGGKPVMVALSRRKTDRNIGAKPLSPQMLSDLLWAACGINRRKGPFGFFGLTAASASNSREIRLYAALPEGLYLYEPGPHQLQLVLSGDLRKLAIGKGQSRMGAQAPVRLIFVVDLDRFKEAGFQEPGLWDKERQKAYYYVDTGLIAGNVYIFAASQGLAAWFHNCDRDGLNKLLGLKPTQMALFGQTVGYPK